MDTTQKPKTMAELLPGLTGLLSKDQIQRMTLTAPKKPRSTMANTRTTEKVLKPLTIAEMKPQIKALQGKSPKPNPQAAASAKKKWNSSCKLENKNVSHTANGQMKHHSVRKVLNFQQPKPKVSKTLINSRMTMMNSETPKFSKPEIKPKKSVHIQAHNIVNISGICDISETPVIQKKPIKSRMTLANKENISNQVNINKKLIATPKSILRKRYPTSPMYTPLSNESWKSSCDDSFIQNEKYIEDKIQAIGENTLGNLTEIMPPASTPFIEYRVNNNLFDNSSRVMESSGHDDTIMCFNKSSTNDKKDESIILSLCDMLNKATVSNTENQSTGLEDLLKIQKQIEDNVKTIENGIQIMTSMKESEMISLQHMNKLIQEKRTQLSECDKIESAKELPNINNDKLNFESLIIGKPGSVIKTIIKSPIYKIPKKNNCMRKKVIYKSMPNIPAVLSPQKDMGEKALSMYLKIKERNCYLSTPGVKTRPTKVPDTPAITSHNLQKQLDKLYDEH